MALDAALEQEIIDCLSLGGETTELLWAMLDEADQAAVGSLGALDVVCRDLAQRGLIVATEGWSHHGIGSEIVPWWESRESAASRRYVSGGSDNLRP